MIKCITGVPRSGKSYYSVDYLYNNFIKKENTNYKYIYTNIASFNFELFDALKKDKEIKTYKLDYGKLEYNLKVLKVFYDNEDEEGLIREAKRLKLFDSLIIIDEAHKYFSKRSDLLNFFLTYHGHMNMDIFLITQNIKLMNTEYLASVHEYLSFQKRGKALRSNVLKGFVYDSHHFSDKTKINTIKIKMIQEVHSLYKSGDKDRTDNYVKKIIGYVAILIVAAIMFGTYAFNRVIKTKQEKVIETKIPKDFQIKKQYKKTEIKKPEIKKTVRKKIVNISIICNEEYCGYKNDLNSIYEKKYIEKFSKYIVYRGIRNGGGFIYDISIPENILKNKLNRIYKHAKIEKPIIKKKKKKKGYESLFFRDLIDY
jgi:zona occludens toxin